MRSGHVESEGTGSPQVNPWLGDGNLPVSDGITRVNER
jgi:hypothetical protein